MVDWHERTACTRSSSQVLGASSIWCVPYRCKGPLPGSCGSGPILISVMERHPDASTAAPDVDGRITRRLTEQELAIAIGGDLFALAPVMNAVAVVAQHAADAAAVDVAVHSGLPGIDLAGEQ